MFLTRLRPLALETVERSLIRLFSTDRYGIRWIAEEWGEREILGSLGVYAAPAVGGGAIYALAYDCGGAEFPTFIAGWQGSLGEIEVALWMVEQGVNALASPLAVVSHPAIRNLAWHGWGPEQAAGYFLFFCSLAASSSALRPPERQPDATGIG